MLQLFKSQETIIKEIHDSFDSAQERLLSEAKEIIEKHVEQPISERGARLEKIGFTNTPDAIEHKKRLEQYAYEQQEKQKMLEFAKKIEMYKYEYPFLKFLSEGELDKICQKYGLIYAPVDRYKKTVPNKNILDIENAQELKDVHRVSKRILVRINEDNGFVSGDKAKYDQAVEYGIEYYGRPLLDRFGALAGLPFVTEFSYRYTQEEQDLSGLFIAAPASHFDLDGLKKNKLGFFKSKIFEVKDPIVFRYCKGGIQVITKWGLEANDPALVNEKMN